MASYGQDYYRILQVHPQAEPEVIQAAYRRLARMYHPDTAAGDGAQMQLINEAYETLADTDRRADYDRWYRLNSWRSPTSPSPPPASTKPHNSPLLGQLLRPILATSALTVLLTILGLDLFRLGIRGLPEITILLVVLGWLVYRFGGFRDIWRG
ncbi:MAG: J domain-containing protein [Caldilineales bacterium]|nr:J domain-containing protein [Caldilineales bacterium]